MTDHEKRLILQDLDKSRLKREPPEDPDDEYNWENIRRIEVETFIEEGRGVEDTLYVAWLQIERLALKVAELEEKLGERE